MTYRELGTSGLRVSLLGYGAWALGGDGWEGFALPEAMATLELACEAGVTFFDTAPVYGLGKSEERLGGFLRGMRKEVVLATKCGLIRDRSGQIRKDLSRDAILFDLDASLRRLQTDYIDLYQVHWPDNRTPYAETFGTLKGLQEEGVIRHIGVSNYSLEAVEKAGAYCRIASVQNRYNLLQREEEEGVLPYCREQGIGFIPYSPLAQGLLTGTIGPEYHPAAGGARSHNPLFIDRSKLEAALAVVAGLESPPARTALRFLCERPEVASVIISMTKREHLRANVQAIESPGC